MALSALKDFANSTTATVVVAGAMALTSLSSNAQTVPYTSGCHDGPSVEAAMAKDGQKTIFIGKRADAEGKFPGNAITMNDNGYGYNFERDPVSQKLCLVSSFKNVVLNYVENEQMPDWGKQIKPSNGIDVTKAYSNGARLVFLAQSYSKDANGREILGKAIVISAMPSKDSPSNKAERKLSASVWSVDRNAIPDSSYSMKDFIIKSDFNHFMGRGFNAGASTINSNDPDPVLAMKTPVRTTGLQPQ